MTEPTVERFARVVTAAFAVAVIVGFALLLLYDRYDLPNVVNCTGTPTISVEVEVMPDRGGHLVKREFWGCDWYWYGYP